jgi:hypothetical protein
MDLRPVRALNSVSTRLLYLQYLKDIVPCDLARCHYNNEKKLLAEI